MCAHTDPSTRSPARPFKERLILATVLALLVCPQGLLAQEALSLQEPLPQAYGQPVEDGRVGVLGSGAYPAWRAQRNSTFCDFGQPDFAALCQHTNGTQGWLAEIGFGVFGRNSNGNFGSLGSFDHGAYGEHTNGNAGFLGRVDYGASGVHNSGNRGSLGSVDYGVYGKHLSGGNYGSIGGSFYGARGWNSNDNRGYLGHDSYGVWGTGSPWAGYFQGDVHVTGTLTGGTAAFKVDHPLDPANQYLAHSIVESPDMKTVYDGMVTTDARGEALVELPDYFEALNRDYRYQLTVIGQFAQAIVAEKIRGNRFVIRTDEPNVEVSWQVTGIRHDPWAEANRIVVEEDKPTDERGFYLHPGLYGQPDERSVAWARDPEGMREIQEMPARLEAQRRRMEAERQRLDEARQRMQQRPRQQ